MLDSLIDLQISYPFMPVAVKPGWFDNIKDVRITLLLPASNAISEYKDDYVNDNYIKVVLTGISDGKAHFSVRCEQLSDVEIQQDVPIYEWTAICPASGSYVLVGDSTALSSVPAEGLSYVLNPDVLVVMQRAPVFYYGSEPITEYTLTFRRGNNVSVSLSENGVSLYGAVGAGNGVYTAYPEGTTVSHTALETLQNLGASSINGLQGSLWLDATYPMKSNVTATEDGNITWTISREAT